MNPSRPLQTTRSYYDGFKLALIGACFFGAAVLFNAPTPPPEPAKEPEPPLITFPKDGAKFENPLIPFEGRGEPGSDIRLVIDGFRVQGETVGEDGRWYMQYELATRGKKTAYVHEVGPDGVVGAKSNEVVFFMDAQDAVRLDRKDDLRSPGPVEPAQPGPVPGAN